MKQEMIKAIKERLQSREGDVKAEVQTADELRIELTHAEARVRQVEGWVEEQKKKTEEMAKAKIQTEQEKSQFELPYIHATAFDDFTSAPTFKKLR